MVFLPGAAALSLPLRGGRQQPPSSSAARLCNAAAAFGVIAALALAVLSVLGWLSLGPPAAHLPLRGLVAEGWSVVAGRRRGRPWQPHSD
eukprot:SAG31_NODE_2775_length_5105_cov_4.744706_5_plen_90_part_00